jgi:hypothetical protein
MTRLHMRRKGRIPAVNHVWNSNEHTDGRMASTKGHAELSSGAEKSLRCNDA